MALPRRVKVEAAPNFLASLEAAHQFFVLQDADSAKARFAALKSGLREMLAVLAWSPASGRPARFLSAQSPQSRLKLDAIQRLATKAGLPHLREYTVGRQIVLYAHSDTRVVLLAVKDQRQLIYTADS